ncbi:MAG: hypothetical protein ACI3X1_02690 [Eubacteriales bacterium]
MYAQQIGDMEGAEGPSIITGAYSDLGARKKGVFVFFKVYEPYADDVYLVGSFNGWRETHRMKKNERGVWEIRLGKREASDGDRYKYKIYGNGQALYITDPCSVETDGEPYYNSVYRDVEFLSQVRSDDIFIRHVDSPTSIYQLEVDGWLPVTNAGKVDYERLADELLPYVLQMGYTHVNISELFEEYYDFAEKKSSRALFAPKGGRESFASLCTFVNLMHKASVGVLVDWYIDESIGGYDADLAFYTENALYWIDNFGVDGFVIGSFECGAEFFRQLVHSIKRERKKAYIIAVSDGRTRLPDVDACVERPERYIGLFKGADGREEEICTRASAAACLLFEKGVMLTEAGFETGQQNGFCKDALNDNTNARLQLFCSELNYACLSHADISECRKNSNVVSTCERDGMRIVRRQTDGGELVLICDLWGRGGEYRVDDGGEWRMIFDSNGLLGIGGGALLHSACGETGLRLSPYGSVLLKKKV